MASVVSDELFSNRMAGLDCADIWRGSYWYATLTTMQNQGWKIIAGIGVDDLGYCERREEFFQPPNAPRVISDTSVSVFDTNSTLHKRPTHFSDTTEKRLVS